ncbi:MAG: hypothetical protein EBZ76_01780 [Synechococcaceae bacterium WB9_2_170]|nr:hypothetical protein [Synechococcaceae bacterium WB9_2_170]
MRARRRGWLLDGLLAIAFGGLMSLLTASGCLLALYGHAFDGADVWFADRCVPWLVARHRATGIWWVNASQSAAPLLGEVASGPDTPVSAEAEGPAPPEWMQGLLPVPMKALPRGARVGAIAFGWPMPAFSRAWVALFQQDTFPMPAEVDVGDAVMENAVRRVGEGSWRDLHLMPAGFAIDTLPWAALGLWSLRAWRRRRLSRPEAGAAPPEPAA